MRGISILDIALWDLKGRALGVPLCRLLGGYRDNDHLPGIKAGLAFQDEGVRWLEEPIGRRAGEPARAGKRVPKVPEAPGVGLGLDEAAVQRVRVG